MKFIKLKMKNFMRFRGENEINFSRDPEKNVTVVLGDNTVGKTTLAQAFRWVLYNEMINTQYETSKAVCILNNEILSDMTANDRQYVEVELDLQIEAKNGEITNYRIIRTAEFVRKFPQLVAKEVDQKLKMYVEDDSTGKSIPYEDKGNDTKVTDLISELLPRDLSSYFLFDGEKWSDPKQAKNDIKESVYSLVGVSPIRQMKIHLGDGNLSVIKHYDSKMVGSGDKYKRLKEDEERYYSFIERDKKDNEDYIANAKQFDEKADEINALLSENPSVEHDQKEYQRVQRDISLNQKMMKDYYTDIVMEFSNKGHEYFATPLLQQIIDLIKDVKLEGSDIPDITDKTINKILSKKKCICGHEILAGSYEEKELLNLLRIVPPAVIGTYVGNFRDKLNRWASDSADMFDTIEKKADDYQNESNDYEDNIEAEEKLERKIDKKINFAEQRIKMNNYRSMANSHREQARVAQRNIEEYNAKIKSINAELRNIEAQNKENERTLIHMEYAKALYESSKKIYNKYETELLDSLNELIKKNFCDMFNEQEKYARLDEDYVLKLYYKHLTSRNNEVYTNMEATGLSEGEKIARNFAFIVSILELANNMKESGEDDAQSMPLVLDGPFSKLSTLNTSKVATVMPKAAEQIIIFMLDKDWKPSGLQNFTKPEYMYRIEKAVDENSSVIISGKGAI